MKILTPAGHLGLRLLAAAGGGYALCWALFELICTGLPYDRATLWYLTGQLAPLPLVGVLLWAFASPSPWRALAWPLAAAAAMAALGRLA